MLLTICIFYLLPLIIWSFIFNKMIKEVMKSDPTWSEYFARWIVIGIMFLPIVNLIVLIKSITITKKNN